jgi:hypothetical protein
VVPNVQTAKIDGEWECSGGDPVIIRNWKIAWSDLILQLSWLYTVPAATPA